MHRDDLRADCANCVGLCCVVPAFTKSADFAISKPANRPCPNLGADFRCGIHADLRDRGFTGCTVYDCFGAGQRVVREHFAGRDWREPRLASAYEQLKPLHELMWYVHDARSWTVDPGLAAELAAATGDLERLAASSLDDLLALDVAVPWARVNDILVRASEKIRGAKRRNHRGADLIGADLRRTDLRAASLRGAYLIGANLAGVDLTLADLIGADLRGADVSGADLRRALFLTGPQVMAARGDSATRLPGHLARPDHWAAR